MKVYTSVLAVFGLLLSACQSMPNQDWGDKARSSYDDPNCQRHQPKSKPSAMHPNAADYTEWYSHRQQCRRY